MQIDSLTTLRHDHITCIDDTACPARKNSILIDDHALNREPVPLMGEARVGGRGLTEVLVCFNRF